MSHPLLVFSTLVLRISERYEPEGGGDRPHPQHNPDITQTEPRHNPDRTQTESRPNQTTALQRRCGL